MPKLEASKDRKHFVSWRLGIEREIRMICCGREEGSMYMEDVCLGSFTGPYEAHDQESGVTSRKC